MIVYPAIEAAVNRKSDYVPSGKQRLWGSEMCYCPRKAVMRVQGFKPTIEFDTESLIRMRGGVVWEDETIGALQKQYGDAVSTQFRLDTDTWSCKIDALLDHGTLAPTVIEHKAVGDKWWNYENNLPQIAHVGQLWLYGELYTEIYGVRPTLILFYRSWSNWAELVIDPINLTYDGQMSGKPYSGKVNADFRSIRKTLEEYYAQTALAPTLVNREQGCTFRGKPSCSMYYHCYPGES